MSTEEEAVPEPVSLYSWAKAVENEELTKLLKDVYGPEPDAKATNGSFMPWKIRELLGDCLCAHVEPGHDLFGAAQTEDEEGPTEKDVQERLRALAEYLKKTYGTKNREHSRTIKTWLDRCKANLQDAHRDISARCAKERSIAMGLLNVGVDEPVGEVSAPTAEDADPEPEQVVTKETEPEVKPQIIEQQQHGEVRPAALAPDEMFEAILPPRRDAGPVAPPAPGLETLFEAVDAEVRDRKRVRFSDNAPSMRDLYTHEQPMDAEEAVSVAFEPDFLVSAYDDEPKKRAVPKRPFVSVVTSEDMGYDTRKPAASFVEV